MPELRVPLLSFSFFLKGSFFLSGAGNTVKSQGSQDLPITIVLAIAYNLVKLYFEL